MGTVLLVILILILAGVWPTWSYSRPWGATPASVLVTVLLVVAVLVLAGVIPYWGW